MSKTPTPSPKSTPPARPIEPLKLRMVGGFRDRIFGVLRRWGLSLGLGVVAGGTAGAAAQPVFEIVTGYDPDSKTSRQAEKQHPDYEQPEEDNEKDLVAEAKRMLERAKELYKRDIRDPNVKAKANKFYRETKKRASDMYESFKLRLEYESAPSLAFLIFCLATTLLANKLFRDAAIDRELKRAEAKINELIEHGNAGGSIAKKDINDIAATVLADRHGAIGNAERQAGAGSLGPGGAKKSSDD